MQVAGSYCFSVIIIVQAFQEYYLVIYSKMRQQSSSWYNWFGLTEM